MKRESVDYPMEYLQEQTEIRRNKIRNLPGYVEPDENDSRIPKSVFEYKPVIWQEDEGVWHGLLGTMPEEGIWVLGTSPLECMIEFDKELKERLSEDGSLVYDIDEERRQQIHKEVFNKIDKLERNLN